MAGAGECVSWIKAIRFMRLSLSSLTADNIATWVPDSGHFTPSHSVREKQDRRGESRGI